MTKKRSRNPELRAFGAWLEARRGKATREQISIKLTALGVPLGGSTLAQYEKGTVWAPDPCVLWGLSKIYSHPLEQVIELLKTNRANPSLEVFESHGGAPIPAALSVQPQPPHGVVPRIDDENRQVPIDAAPFVVAIISDLHIALGEARELAHQFRRATSAALLQKARRQTSGARAAPTRKRPASGKGSR